MIIKTRLEDWLRGHAADILESAVDPQRRIAYVVPKSGGRGQKLRAEAEQGEFQLRLVKSIPATPDGRPDFERLATVAFVDASAVERCQDALQQQGSQAVVVSREHFEPDTLLLGRNQYSGNTGKTTDESARRDGPPRDLPPAYAAGPKLVWNGPNHATLVDALRFHATRTGASGGITYVEDGHERFESYAELLAGAKRVLHGLQKLGLKKGDPLPLQITDRQQHFHVVWGCFLGGIIPVTIAIPNRYDAENPVFRKLLGVWKLLGGKHVLASAVNVEPLKKLMPADAVVFDAAALDLSQEGAEADIGPSDVVFYQLTSGSTGTPKCIPETHAAIIAQIKFSTVDVGYDPADRTLNWLPFDHVVPMLTFHMKDTYLGCHAFQAPTAEILAEPMKWLDLMEKHRINYSWSPNFGYKLAATAINRAQAERGGVARKWDLTGLKKLMNAGEQVTEIVCSDFLRLTGLSPAVMQPAFGMAEVATCMTYANDYGSGYGTSIHRVRKSSLQDVIEEADADTPDSECLSLVDLGPPSPGVEIRITKGATRDVLGEGQIGHLQIRGPSVMPGYVRNPEANAESFVGEGWFDSGDLGFIVRGRLTLSGRAKEMIIVRGANFYAYEIEDSVSELPGCRPAWVAATSIYSESTGTEAVLIFFVPDPQVVPEVALANLKHGYLAPKLREVVASIHSRVASAFGVNPEYVVPVTESGFNKTTSGKIQRGAFKKEFLSGVHADVCTTLKRGLQQDPQCVPDWFCETAWQRREVGCDGNADGRMDGASATFVVEPSGQLAAKLSAETSGADGLASKLSRGESRVVLVATPAAVAGAKSVHASLLKIGRAVAQAEHEVELYVVTSRAVRVRPDDKLDADYLVATAGVSGLLKALSAESPRLKKAVQIDADDASADALATVLSREFGCHSSDQEIAIRGGERFARRYVPVGASIAAEVAGCESAASYVRPNAAYVVTGGLGGIGREVVKQILEVEGTSVLVVGRRPDGQRALSELGWTGDNPRVAYAAVDLGVDYAALERAIQSHLARRQQPLAGVFHLAGHYDRKPIVDLDDKSFAESVRAKVQGSLHLHRALKALAAPGTRPTFLHFGSVTSVFAGQGLAAYSAACGFQEVFADFQQTDGVDSRVFVWSIWEDTGVAARDRTLGFAPWVLPIRKPQGLSVLKTLLDSTNRRAVCIGVNARHPDFARVVSEGSDVDFASLCVFHTPAECLDVARLRDANPKPQISNLKSEISDLKSQISNLKFVCLPKMPTTSSGTIDREKLTSSTIKVLTAVDRAGPRNDVEAKLCGIWQEVLGCRDVGREDNFFNVGGDSLSWMSMVAQCNSAFGLSLRAMQILEHVTIAELAAHIGTQQSTARPGTSAGSAPKPDAARASKILLTLKTGSEPASLPVFLFPTVAGTTACYTEMLSYVDARRPMVGLIDPYLTGDKQSRLLPFEQWMERYADAIQSRQPHGPYTLMSYSQGSTWLWGTAEHLLQRGEQIEHCLLLDPFYPGWNKLANAHDFMASWFASRYWPVPKKLIWRVTRLKTRLSGWGWGCPMKTERDRELSLAQTYHKYTQILENLWLFLVYMELDTGVRVLEDFRELKNYPKDQYDDAVDFVCRKCAEKLEGKVEVDYLKDVIYSLSYGLLRAQTYKPFVMPATTRVTVLAPERNGLSLSQETHLVDYVAPGMLKEINVPLEKFDKRRHVTGRLKGDYYQVENHCRCMHDRGYIARCVELLKELAIAK